MLHRFLAWARMPRPPRSLPRPLPAARMVRGVAFCTLISLPLFLPTQAAPDVPELQTSAPLLVQSQRPAWEDSSSEDSPVGGGDPFSIIQLRRSNLFAWPAAGMLTSYFGAGHPTGIDIGLDNDVDTPVWASADGVVSHAGGNKCCDYGLYVILEHETGFTTLYAHLSKLSVSQGERVTQGQQIGLGGATGDATGKHLHFEMLASGHFVDPLRYLPSKQPGSTPGEYLACGDKPVSIDPASQLTLSFGPPDSGLEVEAMTLSPAVAAAPKVQLQGDGAQAVSLAVPAVVAATSRTYAYELALTLKLGEERRDVTCAMALTTMPTLANPPSQVPLHAARSNAVQALQAQQAQQRYQQELWQYQQSIAVRPEPTPTPDLTALMFQAQTILQAANAGSPVGAPPPVAPPPQAPVLVPTLPATSTPTRTPTPAASPTPAVSATPAAPTPTRTPSATPTATQTPVSSQ